MERAIIINIVSALVRADLYYIPTDPTVEAFVDRIGLAMGLATWLRVYEARTGKAYHE